MQKTADLLEEIAALKAMLIASEARNLRKDDRILRLEKLVAAFRQAAFGRRSEKSDPDQFELALEDLETAMAKIRAEEDAEDRATKRPSKPRAANRGSLPKTRPTHRRGDRTEQSDLRLRRLFALHRRRR